MPDLLTAARRACQVYADECFDPGGLMTEAMRELAAAVDAATPDVCGAAKSPPGWLCSRAAGHDGPCAAWPVAGEDDPRRKG